MKKRCLLLFVLAFIFSIQTTLSFAEETDPVTVISVEEYDEFFPYSQAVAALTIEYGVGDDAVPLESVDDIGGAFATRRIIVRTTDQMNDWVGAVRVLHFEDEYVLQFETEAETEKAYEILRADETYQGVYLDKIVQQEPVEADAVIASSLNGDQAHYSWGVQKMGLDVMENRLNEAGYGQADNNPAVVVAVVDTGVSNNRYINGRLVTGYNYVSQNTNTGDDEGHGTHVAGTICDGTPQRVKILPVKVLDSSGRGTSTNIKNGVEYAISQGVDVINLSLGRDDTAQMSDYLDATLQKAYQRGITVVVAAGNSSMDTQYSYPANNPNVLTIAALDENMTLADYSNYGYDVDFALPGSNIESCIPTGMDVISGTSMAAPHAAAAVADLKCWNPDYDPDTIKTILVNSSVDLGDSYLYGNGWINFSDFYIVQYNSNEGNGSPGIQIKNPGSALVLSSAIPTRESHDAVSCSVTLDANGGSVSSDVLTVNSQTDYVFREWNTSADGTGQSYKPGDRYELDEDVTLYAQWDSSISTETVQLPVPTREKTTVKYTIKLYATGGSVSPSSMSAIETISYSFNHWNTKVDGTGIKYDSEIGDTGKSELTLYAQWNSSSTGAWVTLPTPVRNGWTFKGWGTTSVASEGVTGDYRVTANVSLYALWEKIPEYIVTYNANGGTNAPSWQKVLQGETLKLSTVTPAHESVSAGSYTITLDANGGKVDQETLTAERNTVYIFQNWNTEPDGSGTSYKPGESYEFDHDVTLYAQWRINVVTKSVNLPSGTRSGYEFGGWRLNRGEAYGRTNYAPEENVTMYALWYVSGEMDYVYVAMHYTTFWRLTSEGILSLRGNDSIIGIDSDTDRKKLWREQVKTVYIENGVRIIKPSFFDGCKNLENVELAESVVSIESDVFENCTGLKSINLHDRVTSIGSYAFRGCSSLTSINLPDSVTSIGYRAFQGCSSLTSISIPASVATIEDGLFYDCSSLTSFNIPDGVTSIGSSAFYGCSSLTSISIPAGVASIAGSAFGNCNGLTSITVEEGNSAYCDLDGVLYNNSMNTLITYPAGRNTKQYAIPSSVTSIGVGAFDHCSGLASVTIPEGVTSIEAGAFYHCSGLTNVRIPPNVTSIGSSAFSYCSGLTSVEIPSSVTSIGSSAFSYCSGLNSVEIPSSVTSIGDYAFYGCSNLTSVTIPAGVTSIGNRAFYGCYGLTSVTIPSSVTSIGDYAFHGTSNLKTAGPIGSGSNIELGWTSSIPSGVFLSFNSLTSVIIPEGVTSIGSYGFKDCSSILSITIPDSVTSIGYWAFYGCSNLTSVTIPDSVTSIGSSAFEGCSGLTSVTIPDSVTSIGNYAFSGCSGLADSEGFVVVRNVLYSYYGGDTAVIPDYVTSIGDGAFSGCSGLNSVTIPESVTSIGESAFYRCSGLTNVRIPSRVTSIGSSAFCACSGLTNVRIPSRVTSIGNRAFEGCSGLTSVTLPYSLTSIGDFVFSRCSGLKSVSIYSRMTSIGIYAFNECNSLSDIYYEGSQTQWAAISKGSNNSPLNRATKHYNSVILPNPDFVLPAALKTIEEEAFSGGNFVYVKLPEGTESIQARAFADCPNLEYIYIPNSLTTIDQTAFENDTGLTIVGKAGSTAESFADANGFRFKQAP